MRMNSYVTRYGLEFNPFIKNSKEILIETSEYKEVDFRLNNLLLTKGFGVLTGEPGRGKTTIIRNFANTLNEAAYKVVYICMSTLTCLEFYRQLSEKLNVEPSFRKYDNFKNIQQAITRLQVEKKITPIIIIDEANYMNSAILNDFKLLFNFNMDSSDKAIVLLVGLPSLEQTLRLNSHEPLRQRITMNYHLDSLNKEESKKYILEKIKAAGCSQKVFEEAALEAIVNSANGTPRVINKICDKALLIGFSLNKNMIDAEIITKAINEIQI